MGGSVNLQGGGQYQMPGAGYSGMQGSVNAPQTADQYAATVAARQPQQPTYPQGPFAFDINNPDSWNPGNWGGTGTDTSSPWTGTAAPVQNPYYAYGNQTAPLMTASEATAYAPMNIPNMSFARPQFYYPSISNQMAYMQGMGGMGMGLGGMGGYGGYGRFGGLGGGMGYGGYMGMPGYFSGLGAMGSYMPMMQRSYPTFRNQYPALGPVAGYQPRDPGRARAYGSGTSTGGKGMQTSQQQPTTPPAPDADPYARFRNDPTAVFPSGGGGGGINPDLTPVAPLRNPLLDPGMNDNWGNLAPPPGTTNQPEPPVPRPTGPTLLSNTGTSGGVVAPSTPPLIPGEPQYPDTFRPSPFRPPVEPDTGGGSAGLEPSPFTPPVETDTGGGVASVQPGFDPLAGGGLLGGYTMPDMTLPGGGINPDLFVPGVTLPTAATRAPEPTVQPEDSTVGSINRGYGEEGMQYFEP